MNNIAEEEQVKQKKLLDFCSLLPDSCESFLLETGTKTKLSSRLQYARELVNFFDYLENYSPAFCEKERKAIDLSDIQKITSQDISRYLTLNKDKGDLPRTLARRRASISSYFTYLEKQQLIERNPVTAAATVTLEKSDDVVHLELDEQMELLHTTSSGSGLSKREQTFHGRYEKRDYAIMLLLLDTGIRVSELHKLNIADINFKENSLFITRKGNKKQHVYFGDDAKEALRDYLEERGIREKEIDSNGPVFTTLKGERLAIRSIQDLVKKYTKAAAVGGEKGLSPHKMRASYAMTSYAIDHDLLALQRSMGHNSIATTNIYAKATDKSLQKRRNLLSDARKGAETDE